MKYDPRLQHLKGALCTHFDIPVNMRFIRFLTPYLALYSCPACNSERKYQRMPSGHIKRIKNTYRRRAFARFS